MLIEQGIKGVRTISKSVKKGIKTAKFERVIKELDEGIKKTPEAQVKAQLETGGITTADKQLIQTTFNLDPKVITADRAARIRVAALSPERGFVTRIEITPTPTGVEIRGKPSGIPTGRLKVPPPREKIVIQTTATGEKIIFLEDKGQFGVNLFGEQRRITESIRQRLIRDKIILRDDGIQLRLVPELPKVIDRSFRELPLPSEAFEIPRPPPTSFLGEPVKTLDRAALAERQALAELQRKFPFIDVPQQLPRISKPRNVFEEIRSVQQLRMQQEP